MGRSDRAHAGFYRAGYLLEDLAGLAPFQPPMKPLFGGYMFGGRSISQHTWSGLVVLCGFGRVRRNYAESGASMR